MTQRQRLSFAALLLTASILTACDKPASGSADSGAKPGVNVSLGGGNASPAASATFRPPGYTEPPGPLHLYNAEPDTHWDYVANVGDSAVYMAPSSYRLLGGHLVAIAEKITQTPTASDPEAYTIYAMEFDCERHTQKATAYIRYDAANNPLGQAEIAPADQKEAEAGEGTVGHAVSEPLCKTLQLE